MTDDRPTLTDWTQGDEPVVREVDPAIVAAADTAPLLRAEDIAARLRLSPRRIRLIPARELPYLQLEARGERRYRPDDVARYLELRTVRR